MLWKFEFQPIVSSEQLTKKKKSCVAREIYDFVLQF